MGPYQPVAVRAPAVLRAVLHPCVRARHQSLPGCGPGQLPYREIGEATRSLAPSRAGFLCFVDRLAQRVLNFGYALSNVPVADPYNRQVQTLRGRSVGCFALFPALTERDCNQNNSDSRPTRQRGGLPLDRVPIPALFS